MHVLERLISATDGRLFSFTLDDHLVFFSSKGTYFSQHELPTQRSQYPSSTSHHIERFVEKKMEYLSPLGKRILKMVWGRQVARIALTKNSLACCLFAGEGHPSARQILLSLINEHSGKEIQLETQKILCLDPRIGTEQKQRIVISS